MHCIVWHKRVSVTSKSHVEVYIFLLVRTQIFFVKQNYKAKVSQILEMGERRGCEGDIMYRVVPTRSPTHAKRSQPTQRRHLKMYQPADHRNGWKSMAEVWGLLPHWKHFKLGKQMAAVMLTLLLKIKYLDKSFIIVMVLSEPMAL